MENYIATFLAFILGGAGLGIGLLMNRLPPRRSCAQLTIDGRCETCQCREKDDA